MPERGGFQPEQPEQPDLPEPNEIIERISEQLSLNPDAKPEWQYGPPVERIFSEEAHSIMGRRQAHHCLARLYYYLEWRLQGEKPRVNPQDLIYTYEHVREEQLVDFDPDYELTHVLGATKRQITWLKELRQYEETPIYNKSIKVYGAILNLLEQVVRPDVTQPEQVREDPSDSTDTRGKDDTPF